MQESQRQQAYHDIHYPTLYSKKTYLTENLEIIIVHANPQGRSHEPPKHKIEVKTSDY